jgi:uncharacterized protein YndB with AHSA1/START domain
MATVRHTIPLPIDQVFAALVDPETYPHWLVGARDIRAVDDGWPAPGTAFHHRVGLVGPLTVADLTKVIDIDEPRRLGLEVRARPFGRGRATFTLHDERATGVTATVVEIDEAPIGLLAATTPLVDPLTALRNRRSLRQLADFLRSGQSHRAPG